MIEQLTAAMMAVRVGVSERSVQRWIQEGRLQAKRMEDSSLYEVESTDLERLRLRGHREEESRLQAAERQVTELAVQLEASEQTHQEQLTALERRVNDLLGQVEQIATDLWIATEQLTQLTTTGQTRMSEIETQLHEMRVVFLSDVWRTAPEDLKAMRVRMDALEQRLSTLPTTSATVTTPGTPETATKPKTPRSQTAQPEGPAGESSELPGDLVSARSFGGRHGIAENTINKAIKSGRLPVIPGRWKVGAAYVQKALDQTGQAQFIAMYRSNPNFHQCDYPECPCHQ